MIATVEFERDATEMENDFPVQFLFGGIEFIASKDESNLGLLMAEAGYNPRRRIRLVCRISQFLNSVPVANDLITLEDVIYRVETPEYSPDGINITLPLVQSS